MFNTNGVLLDEKLARDLINSGLDNIFFSVDSINPEKYEQIRIGAKYENVIENIKRFTAINEELGHPVFVRVQKVLMDDTGDENEEYKKFFSGIVDQVAFSECVPYVDESSFGEQIIHQCSGEGLLVNSYGREWQLPGMVIVVSVVGTWAILLWLEMYMRKALQKCGIVTK